METLDKGMSHVLGETEWMGQDFTRPLRMVVQLKSYELFIPGIFHIKFLDSGWLSVIETQESETVDRV